MRIIIVGGAGTIGQAVVAALSDRHEIVVAARRSGSVRVDLRSPDSVLDMYREVGSFDAVVCTAGEAHFGPFGTMSEQDLALGSRASCSVRSASSFSDGFDQRCGHLKSGPPALATRPRIGTHRGSERCARMSAVGRWTIDGKEASTMSSQVAAGGARLNVRQAAFIGVGAMVGAGIFSLLGAAGEVAGAAVWISFVLAGAVAMLQGYSFARFGARFPSAGGLLEYVRQGYGGGHVTGVVAWLLLTANAIITAMVAVSFGSYASTAVTDGDETWGKVFAVAVILVMTGLNVVGSKAVARAQTVVVVVVIGILAIFAVSTISTIDADLLDPSGYPSVADIVASVALTFFAFLGFGVITFTAKDLADPPRQLPRAMFLALGIATVIYVAVSLGVFGTLTVGEVIESGGTALAVAAEPTLGRAGYWMMTVTALFATAGATNAGLYPAAGLCEEMAGTGQFPPAMGARLDERVPVGLVVTAVSAALLAVFFDLSAIASIGSVVALVVFSLITVGHVRVRGETGANVAVLAVAIVSTVAVLVAFVFTTLVDEPATAVTLVVITLGCIVVDAVWKSRAPVGGPSVPSAGVS